MKKDNPNNSQFSSKHWNDIQDEDVTEIQQSQFKAAFDLRLQELGFDKTQNQQPTKSLFVKLSEETSMDWRTLMEYYSNSRSLNKIGYRKLYKAFRYLNYRLIDSYVDLFKILEEKKWSASNIIDEKKVITTAHGSPSNEPLSKNSENIKFGLKGIINLWGISKKLPLDQLERIDASVKFEKECESFFNNLLKKSIFIYYAKVPLFSQPPEELLNNLGHDRKIVSARAFLILTGFEKSPSDKLGPIEINWDNLKA